MEGGSDSAPSATSRRSCIAEWRYPLSPRQWLDPPCERLNAYSRGLEALEVWIHWDRILPIADGKSLAIGDWKKSCRRATTDGHQKWPSKSCRPQVEASKQVFGHDFNG